MVGQYRSEVEEWRAALQKVLDSEVFSGSRRLSDFCLYSAEAAIEGRTEIDQYEIAEKVLGRSTDFDPWDNAAVRKLGTQLRQKLDQYYSGPGASDPVVLFLPRRSYVLRFRRREEGISAPALDSSTSTEMTIAPPPAVADAPAEAPARAEAPRAWPWVAIGVLLVMVATAGWFVASRPPSNSATLKAVPASRIVIDTQSGDLRGKILDVNRDAVRVGPVLGDGEEASVRLRFTPEYPTQQAGLMALYDPDNFVRVGPHFKSRTFLEFGFEHEGVYHGPESTYVFDPLGGTGQARWLALRRTGPEYTAYVSSDGFSWNQFGDKLTLPDTSGDLHAAVYAFNGRSANPSGRAVFDHLGSGLAFHHRPDGPLDGAQFPGWKVRQECRTPVSATVTDGLLQVGFAADASGCGWEIMRPAPAGDWAISALVDFEAVSGSAFGLIARGSRSSASITRRDLEGRSLQLEQNDDRDTRIPDYPGLPPVMLRLEKKGGTVLASVSRDLETFTTLPGAVSIGDIGDVQRIGAVTSVAHWTSQQSRPPARIYWIRVERPTPGFLGGGNVP
jgi:hypothetical protein